MAKKINMCEFVMGGCESAKEPDWFVGMWIKTKGNPCLSCNKDLPMCLFYRVLVDSGVIIGDRSPLRSS
jgi:hypothetical protein